MKIKVIKRDGSSQDFQPEKIARVVAAAGLDADHGQTLASNVARWAENSGRSRLTSLQIRNEVLKNLREMSQPAANLFEWYGKTKE